ncbi:hypothetical protein F5Y03DRAFT_352537 [Xylaria venustula]|nr:hypothetical protein F5Y03DRAFT_352537 [Xylaria venustula]
MQIKLAVILSLVLGAVSSPIAEVAQRDNPKITGPKPYKVFNRETDDKPYKVFNAAVESEKRDNPKITGPKPYKVFNIESSE